MPISKLDNLASVISNRTAIILGYEFNEKNRRSSTGIEGKGNIKNAGNITILVLGEP